MVRTTLFAEAKDSSKLLILLACLKSKTEVALLKCLNAREIQDKLRNTSSI
jgi:hypothetical protein